MAQWDIPVSVIVLRQGLGALTGAVLAQKVLQGSETETRELMGGKKAEKT